MSAEQVVMLLLSLVFVSFAVVRAVATWRLSTAARRAAKSLEVIASSYRTITSDRSTDLASEKDKKSTHGD